MISLIFRFDGEFPAADGKFPGSDGKFPGSDGKFPGRKKLARTCQTPSRGFENTSNTFPKPQKANPNMIIPQAPDVPCSRGSNPSK